MNPVKIKSYHPINPNYDSYNDDDDDDGDGDDNNNNNNNKQDSLSIWNKSEKSGISPFL